MPIWHCNILKRRPGETPILHSLKSAMNVTRLSSPLCCRRFSINLLKRIKYTIQEIYAYCVPISYVRMGPIYSAIHPYSMQGELHVALKSAVCLGFLSRELSWNADTKKKLRRIQETATLKQPKNGGQLNTISPSFRFLRQCKAVSIVLQQ
jgi:hypothetical protein